MLSFVEPALTIKVWADGHYHGEPTVRSVLDAPFVAVSRDGLRISGVTRVQLRMLNHMRYAHPCATFFKTLLERGLTGAWRPRAGQHGAGCRDGGQNDGPDKRARAHR
jgi:hypothetical protein